MGRRVGGTKYKILIRDKTSILLEQAKTHRHTHTTIKKELVRFPRNCLLYE